MKKSNVKYSITLSSKIVLTIIVLLVATLLCLNSVQAFEIVRPEKTSYIRWNTPLAGTVDVKSFLEANTGIEGIGDKVYTSDNKEVPSDTLVGTGMYVKVKNDNTLIIVKGDLNGDGKVTPTDLSKLKQMLVKSATFDYCYQKAADMNNDNEITTTDVSLLKMFLVGMTLPAEQKDPNSPKLNGQIEIKKSTETAAKQLTITVSWPEGENIEDYGKKISLDGGQTFVDYTAPITLDKNAAVTAAYVNAKGEALGSETVLIKNIDTEAPDDFAFTTETTTSSITVNAKTKDKLKDYTGTLVENEYTGVKEYLYKLDDGEWQKENKFEKLTANKEYKVYVKAVDYAGNEKEATNNGTIAKTNEMDKPGASGIKIEYSETNPTNKNVTVTFTLENKELADKYDIQYQEGATTGEWIKGNTYTATGNCTVYARIADKSGQGSTEYVTANVANIDKLQPEKFTPEVTYNASSSKTIISAKNVKDAPADKKNMSSGIADKYVYNYLYKDGKIYTDEKMTTTTNTYEVSENLLETTGKENPVIAVIVDIFDKAGNTRRSEAKYLCDVKVDDGKLGIDNFNEGPGNQTIQGADKSYDNPVIPVGFKAVETPDASWGPYLPSGWDNGLVIEDKKGNQFIWVPVPCGKDTEAKDALDAMVLDTRTTCNIEGVTTRNILEDELPSKIEGVSVDGKEDETGKYGYTYSAELLYQVKEYQGFYIARYEAGRKDGILAVQQGLETVNNVTYANAKNMAESLYSNPYVVSGLPTGLHWDLLSAWVAKEKGMEYVQSTKDGNINRKTFTFSGKYAEGPAFNSGETRGEYKTGENVTKENGKPVLLATGLVEEFKIKNAYDLFGNVWEYTTEKAELNGKYGVNARAGDYYWDSSFDGPNGGIYYRGFVDDGDAKNEGGFRPVLFLFDGLKMEGYNRTIDGGKAAYNNPIIPAGYNPVNEGGANWGDGTTPAVDWDKGLVIQDKNGNQYVWVPVDGTNVPYETWVDNFISHDEVGASEMPAKAKELGITEDTMVNNYGGFYIARYETSEDEEGNLQTQDGKKVKTNVSYEQAVEAINKFEPEGNGIIGIVTGKQWDTTLKWIANELGEEAVTTDSSSWGNYNQSAMALTGARVVKNIYDLAGNAAEITSETYEEKITYRGGSTYNHGDSVPAGYRDAYERGKADKSATFRMVLYVKGDNCGANDVEVPADKPGMATPGTVEGSNFKFELDNKEWTNQNVRVTITPKNQSGKVQYAITPVSTNKQGEWLEGNDVYAEENMTISAKLVDETGNIIAPIENYTLTNIDKVAPAEFTPTVTVEKNRVRITCSTTDDASGIKQYHFYMDDKIEIREATKETEVLSKELPIGEHEFYVVAEDNAGNLRESTKVKAKSETAKFIDIIEQWDYVKTKIYDKATYSYKDSPLPPVKVGGGIAKGTEHTLQVIAKTRRDEIVPIFNGKGLSVFAESSIYNTNTGNYDQVVTEYCIGERFVLPPSGVVELYGLKNAYNNILKNANITGGSGTKEDPYTVDFMWEPVLKNKLWEEAYGSTGGSSWFQKYFE